jgi:small subunit ribosomal protein S6
VRRYELMLLFQPDLEDDQLQAAVERVTRAIVNAGGSLSKISPWGKRRLAYPIQHHRDASYFLIHFDIEPSAVRDIERGLLISEEILRHLVVVLAPRQRRAADETVDGAASEAEDALAPPPDIDEDDGVRSRPAADRSDAESSAGDEAGDADSDGTDEDEHTADLKAAEEVVG